jgi:hypothetical protein
LPYALFVVLLSVESLWRMTTMRFVAAFARGMLALLVMLLRATLQMFYLAFRAIAPSKRSD